MRRNLVTEHTGEQATFEPNKKEQLSPYGSYAKQLCELANQYTTLSSERLDCGQQSRRNCTPARRRLDQVGDQELRKAGRFPCHDHQSTYPPLLRASAKSYLTKPQDVVTIEAEFAELPDGTNHVATTEIDSVSKRLTVKLTNWSYQ